MVEHIDTSNQRTVSNGQRLSLSRTFTFTKTLIAGSVLELDLSQQNVNKRLQNVQGAFVDNTKSAAPVTLSLSTGQNIVVPPGMQATMPVFWSGDYLLNLTGAGSVTITLTNFPVPACVWGSMIANGNMTVQDVTLVELSSPQGLNTVPNKVGSGGNWYKSHAADVLMGGAVGTADTVIYGANSALFFLRSLKVWALPGYQNNSAINLLLKQNGITVATIAIPAFASATTAEMTLFDISDADVLAAGPFAISLSAAPTAGAILFSAVGANASE